MSDTTTSTQERHKYTNDVLAGLIIASNVVLLGWGTYVGLDVPGLLWKTFALAVARAAPWAFGRGALKEILGWLPGDGGGK